MKKIFLLLLAATTTATYAADTPTMTNEEAAEILLFSTWDTARLIRCKSPEDFGRFSNALKALTPKTRRKEIEKPLIKKIITAQTAALEEEQNKKDKIKKLRKINFQTIQELEELKSASSKRGRSKFTTPSPTSKQASSKLKTK